MAVIERIFRMSAACGDCFYAERLDHPASKWTIRDGSRFGEVVATAEQDQLLDAIQKLKGARMPSDVRQRIKDRIRQALR